MDNTAFIEKILKIYNTPGGRAATATILRELGAEQIVGDIEHPSYTTVGMQNVLENDLKAWIAQANPNLENAEQIIYSLLSNPTKENFSFLLGEVLEIEKPFLLQSGHTAVVVAMLNPNTVKEFEKFEKAGLIEIITDINDVRLNPMRPDQKILIDKKRELGTGYKCAIQLNQSLYQ